MTAIRRRATLAISGQPKEVLNLDIGGFISDGPACNLFLFSKLSITKSICIMRDCAAASDAAAEATKGPGELAYKII